MANLLLLHDGSSHFRLRDNLSLLDLHDSAAVAGLLLLRNGIFHLKLHDNLSFLELHGFTLGAADIGVPGGTQWIGPPGKAFTWRQWEEFKHKEAIEQQEIARLVAGERNKMLALLERAGLFKRRET